VDRKRTFARKETGEEENVSLAPKALRDCKHHIGLDRGLQKGTGADFSKGKHTPVAHNSAF